MTRLAARKRRAQFETDSVVFSKGTRPVMVELHPDRIVVRLKGNRTRYALGYDALFMTAMKKAMLDSRVARMMERKAQKVGGKC